MVAGSYCACLWQEVEGEKAEESSRDVINRDLQELLRVGCVDDTNEVQDKDENLPPLLQVSGASLRGWRNEANGPNRP